MFRVLFIPYFLKPRSLAATISEMSKRTKYFFLTSIILIALGLVNLGVRKSFDDANYVNYIINPKKQNIEFFWKNKKSENYKNAENLISWLKAKNKKLLFSTNGGMYKKDRSPVGLFIENGIRKTEIDTSSGGGNFYLKPNGIFYITKQNSALICETTQFKDDGKVKFATQSGPMLLLNGEIHSAFKKESVNLNIRNGVGILPNNEIIFAMSKKEINFFEFAEYFKQFGCKNALYLDGFVSRTYLPEKEWRQIDGDFGVIIGVTK